MSRLFAVSAVRISSSATRIGLAAKQKLSLPVPPQLCISGSSIKAANLILDGDTCLCCVKGLLRRFQPLPLYPGEEGSQERPQSFDCVQGLPGERGQPC